jgi:lipoprotein-releasing system ATP-binding protein
MEALAELAGVRRSFVVHGQPLEVLRGVDLVVRPGERVAVLGPSGAGKSTLLGILGLIDDRFEGTYRFLGRDVREASPDAWSEWRLHELGFAFQDLHLVPSLTALENLMLVSMAAQQTATQAHERAEDLLSAAGLASRLSHRPGQLSGGERRRVAFARALANRPRLLLVDEPTGDLDEASTKGVLALLERASAEGAAIVAVTHDPRLVRWCTSHHRLREGHLEARDLEQVV